MDNPDLSITLGQMRLKNPVMGASGTFGFGEEHQDFLDLNQLGAIIPKGVSLRPVAGNPPPRLFETEGGILNAIGLQNPGLDVFLKEKMPFLRTLDTCVIVNFFGNSDREYVELAGRLNDVPGVSGLEMNVSCPNMSKGGIVFCAHSEELAKHAGGDYTAASVDSFARAMAERGVWMSPTLATTRAILETLDHPGGAFARPEAAYFRHPLQAGVWSFIVERLYSPIPPQARQTLRDAFERFQGPLTLTFHAKGGKLLAGSDAIIPGLVPGFALHRELAELVKAGLSPYEALPSSTTRCPSNTWARPTRRARSRSASART